MVEKTLYANEQFRVPLGLRDQIRNYCERHGGLSVTAFYRLAAHRMLDEEKKQSPQRAVAEAFFDLTEAIAKNEPDERAVSFRRFMDAIAARDSK